MPEIDRDLLEEQGRLLDDQQPSWLGKLCFAERTRPAAGWPTAELENKIVPSGQSAGPTHANTVGNGVGNEAYSKKTFHVDISSADA
jgi:hypothetical protein